MVDDVKKFIEANIGLIEINNWEEVYEKADKLNISFGEFTEIMLDADIHPELYLRELPNSFLAYSKIKKFEIPSNITSIGPYAFYRCINLESIVIGNSVKIIDEYAFLDCARLTSVVIPDSVTIIGQLAFRNCSKLASVMIGDSVTNINWRTFWNCTSLTDITIGKGVTNVNGHAFEGCTSLTNVIIPNSVVKIDLNAFSNCGDKLVIDYSGTKADWKKIYDPKAFKNTYFTVNCTDGKIVKKKR